MVFNAKDIPKIKIKEVLKGDMEISKDETSYILYRNGRQENCLNIKTNKEAKEVYSSYDLGYGDILISGLGFGILALWLAKKPEVKSIKILEISQDIVDIFLENNTLPDNVTIEIADAEKYTTEDHYDCILLDHYEWCSENYKIQSMQNVAKNVPNHDLMWIWSIEHVYTRKCYDGLYASARHQRYLSNQEDFSGQWEFFKNEIVKLQTLPDLSDDKINEYIYTYADFLNSKYVLLKDKNK
jgi:hypothetical protein